MTAFRQLRRRAKRPSLPGRPARAVKMRVARSPNYARIEIEVMAEVARLSRDQQANIPFEGTLPEHMVALALVWLGYPFQWQAAQSGGRIRLGGSVVDFLVDVSGRRVVVRVQGDYWHSLPERKRADAVQADRLRALRYLVSDLWESDIYEAWMQGNLRQFVEQGVLTAT